MFKAVIGSIISIAVCFSLWAKDIDGNGGVIGNQAYTDYYLSNTQDDTIYAIYSRPNSNIIDIYVNPEVSELYIQDASLLLNLHVVNGVLSYNPTGFAARILFFRPDNVQSACASGYRYFEVEEQGGGIQFHTIGTSPSGYITIGKVECQCESGCVLELRPIDNPNQVVNIYMDFGGIATYPAGQFIGNLYDGC